ncbi:MAG: Plasminogen [Parcubacteria group bacterium GW2011_GWA1_50_14]|uniref:Uncharacterized protein n=1 Tax=Candidatus Liptonbacteria bacterium GWB1_49_6 TaxID=1798644 RepID=A0A1G2C7U1_9BACT|nr:MAG: Plasminogen [Parcubacteria group bacterium GW2011_GWA1_50_14]OGY96730.1 MAG: hypothetical protein A2122_02395 [Candidatus Liptonbacteria bacterium GWB1_49_6]
MIKNHYGREQIGMVLVAAIVGTAFLMIVGTVFAVNISTSVVVDNASPAVSTVKVNDDSDVNLTENSTTNVNVIGTITDDNGCTDVNAGTAVVLLYRQGITSSTCNGSQNALNCYKATAFTATSTCAAGSQNTTTTFAVQYFAQATDASSSFPTQNWMATIIFTDPQAASGNKDSQSGSTPDVITLIGINVTTSSINYGAVAANTNTQAVNQTASSTNAGNSSTTLQLRASATLTSAPNSITTSSQHYATSSFTYNSGETELSETLTTVTGFLLTAPTSTVKVSGQTLWGLAVPNGTPTGTYSGTNVFSALFQP